MELYKIPVQIRWSDLDPNNHLRHSVYYDWGALCRIQYFEENKLTPAVMHQLQIGPVIFREECVFKKEIHLGDKITIDLHLIKARRDMSRWSIRHTIYKEEKVAATLTIDCAWIDLTIRKLAAAPPFIADIFSAMPHGDIIWDE